MEHESHPPRDLDLDSGLRELQARYPAWWELRLDDSPIYAIPSNVFKSQRLCSIFGDNVHAERAFSAFCTERSIVGTFGYSYIAYGLLTRSSIVLPEIPNHPSLASKLWTRAAMLAVEQRSRSNAAAADRMLGVAGWLTTEPTYLEDLEQIRTLYSNMAENERPRFPLAKLAWGPGDGGPRERTLGSCLELLGEFLDRWGLDRLETWDLPIPRGPLISNLLPVHSPANPLQGIHVTVPLHYPLQGDDAILEQIKNLQTRRASELGMPPGFGGISHAYQYAQMFRLIFLELVIHSRFRRGPRGLVAAIEQAASEYLGVETSSVSRLRAWVRACREGRRHEIAKLQD